MKSSSVVKGIKTAVDEEVSPLLISSLFTPLIDVLIGAGILKGLLSILTATNLLTDAWKNVLQKNFLTLPTIQEHL